MKLKAEKKTIFHVDYHDLERFIESIYGGSFEMAAIEEANNYSSKEYTVDGEIDGYDNKHAAEIRKGNYPTYCTDIVLNLLALNGHIEKGEYIIKISW